jgi:hypothetical protein
MNAILSQFHLFHIITISLRYFYLCMCSCLPSTSFGCFPSMSCLPIRATTCWTDSAWFAGYVSATLRKVNTSSRETALLYHDFADDPIYLGRLVHGTFSTSKKRVCKCGATSRQKLLLDALLYESSVVDYCICPQLFESRHFTWLSAWR